MRCARCGDPITEDDERCGRCGMLTAALVSAPPLLPDSQGVPVARLHPTPTGALAASEPYLSTEPSVPLPPARRAGGLRIVSPLPSRRQTALPVWSSLILTIFVAAGLATGVLVLTGVIPLPPLPHFSGFGSVSDQTQRTPDATVPPRCSVSPPVASAAAALSSAQLSTGVRDEQGQDFRPIDNVSTFHAGARAFITFEIVTQAAGTAEVSFCTPDGTIPGILNIPARSSGRYAQFSLQLPQKPLDDCVATLEWNGAVAASLPFTVEP